MKAIVTGLVSNPNAMATMEYLMPSPFSWVTHSQEHPSFHSQVTLNGRFSFCGYIFYMFPAHAGMKHEHRTWLGGPAGFWAQ